MIRHTKTGKIIFNGLDQYIKYRKRFLNDHLYNLHHYGSNYCTLSYLPIKYDYLYGKDISVNYINDAIENNRKTSNQLPGTETKRDVKKLTIEYLLGKKTIP